MRLPCFSALITVAAALSLLQGCATELKAEAVNIRIDRGGTCKSLGRSFACDDVVDALTNAGVTKAAKIEVQVTPGVTIREVITLMNTLDAAGFAGLNKTAVASEPNGS